MTRYTLADWNMRNASWQIRDGIRLTVRSDTSTSSTPLGLITGQNTGQISEQALQENGRLWRRFETAQYPNGGYIADEYIVKPITFLQGGDTSPPINTEMTKQLVYQWLDENITSDKVKQYVADALISSPQLLTQTVTQWLDDNAHDVLLHLAGLSSDNPRIANMIIGRAFQQFGNQMISGEFDLFKEETTNG